MKRYILLSIVLALIVMLCGCNNSSTDIQTDNNTQQELTTTPDTNTSNEVKEDAMIGDVGISIDNMYPITRDIFTAEVIKRVGDVDDSTFSNYKNRYATPVLYHVKVQKSICTQVATVKQTIKVVHYEFYEENKEYFIKPLEVGKTYLFGGMAQVSGEEVVFLNTGSIASEVVDGNLIPMSSPAKYTYLTNIKTISEFENYPGIKKLKNQITPQSLPTTFINKYTAKKDGKQISLKSSNVTTEDYNSYLEVLREAVKVGSKEKLTKITETETLETK